MEWRLPDLPHEIIYDIISRLPAKPLCRFKSVSKPWVALITDPQFVKSHLHHQSTNDKKLLVHSRSSPYTYSVDCQQAPDHTAAELEMLRKPGVRFLGSFNGILLLRIGNILCLRNPSIRVYQEISQPKLSKFSDAFPDAPIFYGLGYDSISDDFKEVRVIRPPYHVPCRSIVHVFSSKLNSWKRWTADFIYDIWGNWSGTVLNGAPHWVCHRRDRITFFPSNQESVIVLFDATEEKFKEVPNPDYEGEDTPIHLGVLGGCLCVVEEHRKGFDSHADFWVMKEYGAKDSWTKLFVVQSVRGEFFFLNLKLLCDTKDGAVVMVLNLCCLVVYNPKQSSYKRIRMPQSCDLYRFRAGFYMESLVSPGGCNGTRRLP